MRENVYSPFLAEDILNDVGFVLHAGEALVEALEFKGELGVVDTETVKDGCIEVADVDGVFENVVAVIIGFSVLEAAFDASSGHPH